MIKDKQYWDFLSIVIVEKSFNKIFSKMGLKNKSKMVQGLMAA
ncbi:hypothetical protein JOD45_000256 [Scopulibacillus daqui]|uniref:Uncharacterized protein n=1 Tax=Scopulibacillus daqui TaxID=1469162 RepID=A0ABS2PWH4_9BACL|nr:hypothetical protein [Scopulibacillus daqui]